MKFEIQTDIKGEIISISKCYNGKTHDFKIRKMSDHVPRNAIVLADSGYQGFQKLHSKTILPHKRRRKIPLTPEQKAHNKSLSSRRIIVEHVFAQLKKFKIFGSVYRNFRKNSILDSISLPVFIICAFHGEIFVQVKCLFVLTSVISWTFTISLLFILFFRKIVQVLEVQISV